MRESVFKKVMKDAAEHLQKLPPNMPKMTIHEAADYIGCGMSTIQRLCREGRLNSWKEGAKSYVFADEVLGYNNDEDLRHNDPFIAVNNGKVAESDDWLYAYPLDTQPLDPTPNLVSRKDAMALLCCSRSWIYELVYRGKLHPYPAIGGARYDVAEIEEIARDYDKRHRHVYDETPGGYKVRHRALAPRPDEKLITIKDTAAILGISISSATHLVCRGVLPAYQKSPGAPGSRLKVPDWAVWALKNRPEYQRDRAEHGKGLEAPLEYRPGWEQYDIPEYPESGYSLIDRDHGEYYTTRQTAVVLNIRRSSVRHLRDSGRLQGYRRPIKYVRDRNGERVPPRGNRWWFYRKEEVNALKYDPEYMRKRENVRRGVRWEV